MLLWNVIIDTGLYTVIIIINTIINDYQPMSGLVRFSVCLICTQSVGLLASRNASTNTE
jgi:hypothetical protein